MSGREFGIGKTVLMLRRAMVGSTLAALPAGMYVVTMDTATGR
jgi:hypothetical protein